MSEDSSSFSGHDLLNKAKIIREKIIKSQESAHQKTVTATVGGGMVTAVANGLNRLVSIKLEPEVINPDDPEMLSDLIVAAVNEALSQIQDQMLKDAASITAGLDLTGLF
ncbi:MAG: YbaB/EbfC family nucleoid-associated protein [Deltaproteobacteria bacterium]|jgi:DNA-binding YbaB/EbfC family protein|nr:YbaB/EbfC family nucleoid-associated protein [Deltaproteobacteria bacterium]